MRQHPLRPSTMEVSMQLCCQCSRLPLGMQPISILWAGEPSQCSGEALWNQISPNARELWNGVMTEGNCLLSWDDESQCAPKVTELQAIPLIQLHGRDSGFSGTLIRCLVARKTTHKANVAYERMGHLLLELATPDQWPITPESKRKKVLSGLPGWTWVDITLV